MDAVKINYPVDVAAPKLMGSEVFGRDRVSTMEVVRKSSASNCELGDSLLVVKDVTCSATALESTLSSKVQAPELCPNSSHLPSFPSEDVSKYAHSSTANSPLWIPRHEEVQVQRKAGQVSRSVNGCSKRPRIMLLEDSAGLAAVDDPKESSNKLGSHLTKCDSNDKTQVEKQKANLRSKRGDRRNLKVSAKTKYDNFSLKASLASFSSAAAGNNFFGSYGLKTDDHDITKLVDEISLNDLLQGTYECPSSGKDKGKEATSTTENFLHTVRKAYSIIQLPRSGQYHNVAGLDSGSNERILTCQSSISIVGDGDGVDSSTTDLSSSNKDSCSKPKTSASLLDFSLDQPRDILERLALPPPKDLESLLLDAAKPAGTSRSAPDPRPGKQLFRRPSLPPFPWSHTFTGHCRSNSDTSKLLTSRSTCQGRWVKMQTNFNSLGTASNSLSKLESFAYEENLVPSCGLKMTALENNMALSTFVDPSQWSSSIAASAVPSQEKESGGDFKNNGNVEHCPRLLAAAQTLVDIATCSLRINQDRTKWPKKPSQKVMKARKLKSIGKHEEIISSPTSITGSDLMARNGSEQTSKQPKLSTNKNKKDQVHINGIRKRPINWSTPKSSRSSPNKSAWDSGAYNVKQSCMMLPPPMVLNKTCNGQQKVRKLIQMDWSRECDRKD